MIKKLDSDVSTRIAAGEVIERPSSVAKELIENSIDAGSSAITVYVEQGGKTSFVIEDNGIGIACQELPLALERYATSKIANIDDLERISTLGYRGEALASVAAVSRMEIRSRTNKSDMGGIIMCEGGVITLHTETPCSPGTRIQVDDLFYNLPARRKFLKSSSAELRRIIQIVNDYALIHPEITFRVISDGKKILDMMPSESVDSALSMRWGEDSPRLCSNMKKNGIEAFVWWNPSPDSRRVILSIFVNGRRIQDATVRAAICNGDAAAYGEWLVIINMPPEQLDVNIHPTKEEVRFRRSQEIFKIIYDTANNIFAKRYAIHRGDTETSETEESFTIKDTPVNSYFDRTNPIFSSNPWQPPQKQSEIFSGRVQSSAESVYIPADDKNFDSTFIAKNYIGQTERGFLLFDFPQALAVMDPHAAHERILFEEISTSFSSKVVTQGLAVHLAVPPALAAEISLHSEDLERLGFTVNDGELTGVPLIRGKGHISPIEMLRSALRGIETESDPSKRDREVWWRIARLACRDAVKLGQRFERQEAETLLKRLEKCSSPYTCPHGRPTIFMIDNKKLDDWFER